jgi:hypothetical protein
MAVTPNGEGYWLAEANGTIIPVGNAADFNLTKCKTSGKSCHGLLGHIVAISTIATGKGLLLVNSNGRVFAFGSAAFLGDIYTRKAKLPAPVVGLSALPAGNGYWLATADGRVYGFQHASFLGGTFTTKVKTGLQARIAGIAYSPAPAPAPTPRRKA